MHKQYRTDSSVWDIRYDSLKGTAGAYKQRESDEKLDASVLWETTSKRVTEFIKSHGRMTFVCVYLWESKCVFMYKFIHACARVCLYIHAFVCVCVRDFPCVYKCVCVCVCARVCLSIVLCVYLFIQHCSTYEQNGGPGVDFRFPSIPEDYLIAQMLLFFIVLKPLFWPK